MPFIGSCCSGLNELQDHQLFEVDVSKLPDSACSRLAWRRVSIMLITLYVPNPVVLGVRGHSLFPDPRRRSLHAAAQQCIPAHLYEVLGILRSCRAGTRRDSSRGRTPAPSNIPGRGRREKRPVVYSHKSWCLHAFILFLNFRFS